VQVPAGWSYDDAWSWNLDDIGDEATAAFTAGAFEFGHVPLAMPPVALRV
jgi:hypothetical protein